MAVVESAHRSLNSEILWRLGQTFSEQWQRFIAGIEEDEINRQEWMKRLVENPKFQQVMSEIIEANPPKRSKPL